MIKLMTIFVMFFVIKSGQYLHLVDAKYVEGHLKTLEDWAFLARFCFISGRGRYEYVIEYEKRIGELQLLLYYDDKTQWPAVYKTKKTCQEKLSVLNVRDNQIVTLSAKPPHNIYSGCTLRSSKEPAVTTPRPPILNSKPDLSKIDPMDPNYFDQFLKPTKGSSSSNTTTESDMDAKGQQNSTLDDTNEITDEMEKSFQVFGLDMGSTENKLENSTNNADVEVMFENYENATRVRREITYPRLFDSEKKGTIIVTCRNIGGFTSSRERWWYIAIANCGSQRGLDLRYKFKMTNGAPGDFWHEHFSADEMYIPPILFAEALAYSLLLVAIFLCGLELKSLNLYHCTYRLFTFSALSQWFGVLLEGVTWANYAVTGIGPHRVVGGAFMGASEISFLLLMLLMAKGYTITRARLSTCSTIKITVFINAYIVCYISLYIYQSEAFDPGDVLNLYESPAGFGLAGLRVGSWVAFVVACAATIRKYPEKGGFYYPFGVLGSLWILSGPFFTLIGVGVLDAWVRESVMSGALASVAFGGHLAFLWLTWPSRANKSFPYHVRTNHVGIAADDDGIDYPRHPYEPAAPEQNIIIPLSRRTEELLNGVYSQYLRERNCYNSASTPISHISFPHQPTAPIQTQMSIEAREDTPEPPPRPPPLHLYKPSDTHRNQLENQIDSGHPSIEGSNTNSSPGSAGSLTESPTHTIHSTTSAVIDSSNTNSAKATIATTPHLSSEPTETNKSASPEKPNSANKKPNPFLANNKGPNKVILQPIELPLRSPTNALVPFGLNSTNVPRHLFTAKSPTTALNINHISNSEQNLIDK